MIKAIMYHYVREFDPARPFFKFLHIDDFRRQLDWFGKHHGFLAKKDWLEFIKNGARPSLNSGKVLLTFDDGLSCHYDYVFKELIERDLWGIFFIPSSPFTDNELLDVHKIHLLLSATKSKEVYNSLVELLRTELMVQERIREFEKVTYKSQSNDFFNLQIKRLLNYFIKVDVRSEIIRSLLKDFDVVGIAKDYYLSKQQMLEMSDGGMIFGSHTHKHRLVSQLEDQHQLHEIATAHKFVIDTLNQTSASYCHPYGGRHSFTQQTLNILSKIGVEYAFSVDSRPIELKDLAGNKKYQLPRFNCNEFAFGKVYELAK